MFEAVCPPLWGGWREKRGRVGCRRLDGTGFRFPAAYSSKARTPPQPSAAPPRGEPRASALQISLQGIKTFFEHDKKRLNFSAASAIMKTTEKRRISSLVEWSLPKPQRRVRFPYPAPETPVWAKNDLLRQAVFLSKKRRKCLLTNRKSWHIL